MLKALRERWRRCRLARLGIVEREPDPLDPYTLLWQVRERLFELGSSEVELNVENFASWLDETTRALPAFDAERCFAHIFARFRDQPDREPAASIVNARGVTTLARKGARAILVRNLSKAEAEDFIAARLEATGVVKDGRAYLRERRAETEEQRRIQALEADLNRPLAPEEINQRVKPTDFEEPV